MKIMRFFLLMSLIAAPVGAEPESCKPGGSRCENGDVFVCMLQPDGSWGWQVTSVTCGESKRSREEIFRDYASNARRWCYGPGSLKFGWRTREEECVSSSVGWFTMHTQEICDLPVSDQVALVSFKREGWIKAPFEERLCDELGY